MKVLGLTKSRFIWFLLVTTTVHIVSYTSLGYPVSLAVFTLGLIIMLYNLRAGLSFFIISLMLFDDINKYDIDLPRLTTIFTIEILGQSLTMLWSIFAFGLIVLNLKVNSPGAAKVVLPVFVLLLLLLVGATRFYQFGNPRFTSDIAFIVNILLGYGIGRLLFTSTARIQYYFGAIIAIFLSKYIIITVHAILQTLHGILYTFKGESAANYLIVPLVLMLLVIFNRGIKFSTTERIIAVAFIVFIISYLLITLSRERMLFVVLALLAYLIVYKKVQIVFYSAAAGLVAIIILMNYNPYMYDFITWKITSIVPTTDGEVNRSSSIRLIEFHNIWREQLQSAYKLIVGAGWGGYFRDSYIPLSESILDPTSYPQEWIEQGKFYIPHGTYLYVLLKYGLLGFALFYGSIVWFSLKHLYDKTVYHFSQADRDVWGLRYIQIAACIALPIGCLVIFTSKLQILTGLLIALIFETKARIDAASPQQLQAL